jgi:hypothetical protein
MLFPSCIRGFDSLRPLHSFFPGYQYRVTWVANSCCGIRATSFTFRGDTIGNGSPFCNFTRTGHKAAQVTDHPSTDPCEAGRRASSVTLSEPKFSCAGSKPDYIWLTHLECTV